MRKLLLFILAIVISVSSFSQFSPSGSKTRFVNGIGLGTKSDAAFGTADSLVLYWRADSVLMYRYKGISKALGGSTGLVERTGPAFVAFNNKNQSGNKLIRGTVGMLGHPEMNLSLNMDYQIDGSGAIHKFFDSTRNALWEALGTGVWALQYAPAGSNTGDVWANGGSKYWIYADSLRHFGINGNISIPNGDAMLYINRNFSEPSLSGKDDLVLEGGRLKGADAPVFINTYNKGDVWIARGGGATILGYSELNYYKDFEIKGLQTIASGFDGGIGITPHTIPPNLPSPSTANFYTYFRDTTSSGGSKTKHSVFTDGQLKVLGSASDFTYKLDVTGAQILRGNLTIAQSANGGKITFGTNAYAGDIEYSSATGQMSFRNNTAAATLKYWDFVADGSSVAGMTGQGKLTTSQYRLSALNTAPSSASDTGTLGEIRIDASYIYICTATNTWKRVSIATW